MGGTVETSSDLFAPLTIAECQEFRRRMARAMHAIRHAEPGRLTPGTVAGPLELELYGLVRDSLQGGTR